MPSCRHILLFSCLAAAAAALATTASHAWLSSPAPTVEEPAEMPIGAEARIVAAGRGRVDVEGGLIQIAAQRDGVIAAVHVTEGAEVRAGMLLARQDDRAARAALNEAVAALAEARARTAVLKVRVTASRRERTRLDGLRRDGAEAAKLFDEAHSRFEEMQAELAAHEASVQLAQARVATAEMEVAQREIRAPVDGRIVRLQARPGTGASTLNVSTLFTLLPRQDFILRADIEERFLNEIALDQPVSVILDGDPAPVRGRVLRIGEMLGQRKIDPTDAQQRVDDRVVEIVVSLPQRHYRIGQRGLAKFEKSPSAAEPDQPSPGATREGRNWP